MSPLIPIQYRLALLQRLRYAMATPSTSKPRRKEGTKKNLSKKIRFQIEVQPGGRVYIDRPSRSVQRPGSKSTDPLTGYSVKLKREATEESRKLLSDTAALRTIQLVTESIAIIDKDEVASSVGLDRVIKMPRRPGT